jgi:hypothetical protein
MEISPILRYVALPATGPWERRISRRGAFRRCAIVRCRRSGIRQTNARGRAEDAEC